MSKQEPGQDPEEELPDTELEDRILWEESDFIVEDSAESKDEYDDD